MTTRDRNELRLTKLFGVFTMFIGLTGGSVAIAQGPLPGSPDVSSVPVGGIAAFGGSTAPPGWLMADGSTASSSQFPELCAVLGSTYGSAPAGECRLPDLRGRVPVGVDGAAGRLSANDTLGASAGEEKHTLTAGESGVKSHGHGVSDPGHSHSASQAAHSHAIASHWNATGLGDNQVVGQPNNTGNYGTLNTSSQQPAVSVFSNTTGITVNSHPGAGADQAHNVMQPYQVVNYIIHAKPAP